MKRTLVLIIVLSFTTSPVNAGWFGKDKEKAPDIAEHVQRVQAEERLKAAQQQISSQEQRLDGQEKTISQLQMTTYMVVAGAVLLLIVGVALGSKAKRDENQS